MQRRLPLRYNVGFLTFCAVLAAIGAAGAYGFALVHLCPR